MRRCPYLRQTSDAELINAPADIKIHDLLHRTIDLRLVAWHTSSSKVNVLAADGWPCVLPALRAR
jgi:hypothetical protein